MQVTRATFIPLLAPGISPNLDPGVVREEYCADLTLVYSLGPPFGRRVVTHADMDQMELTPRTLRRSAFEQLEALAGDRAQFHGQPPSLMLSFDGLESSLLLATEFWNRLHGVLPGELVVGVPARDVVIVTGSQLPQGLEKVRRAVDRVYFAGDENLLTRSLLVRRGGTWEPFDRPARQGSRPAAHSHSADRPPRQYQEHPSWPGERVPVSAARDGRPLTEVPTDRPTPIGRPAPSGPPLAPAAAGNLPRPAATSLPPPPMPTSPPAMGPPARGLPARGPRPGPMGPTGMPSRVAPPMPPMPRSPSTLPTSPTGPPMGGPTPVGPMPGGPVPGARRPGAHSARRPDAVPSAEAARLAELSRLAGQARADAAQYSAIPYSAVPQSAVPYSAVPYSAVPYSAIPYSAVPNSAVPNSAVPYSAVPYSAGRSAAPVSPAGYPAPAFSRGARSRQGQPRPSHSDEVRPTSGGSYSGYMPVSPAPYPFSPPAPPEPPRMAPPAQGAHRGPAYPTQGHEPNPPYQGHAPRDYEREPSYAPDSPPWGPETSANDTFSGLFARADTPSGRYGWDGRSGPRARFSR